MTNYLELSDNNWVDEHERFQHSDEYEFAFFEWEEKTHKNRLRRATGQTFTERESEFQISDDYAEVFEHWRCERLDD